MITERTLRKWRKEALKNLNTIDGFKDTDYFREKANQILRMTQELLDQHLMKRKTKYRIQDDEVITSGHWFKEKEKLND